MSEKIKSSKRDKLNRVILPLAATAAAAALGIGANQAKASSGAGSGSAIERVQSGEQIKSIEEVTTERANDILNPNGGFNIYTGKVVYAGEDGREHVLKDPIIDTRVVLKMGNQDDKSSPGLSQTSREGQWIMSHPGDARNVFGYIQRGIPGNLGKDNLVMFSSKGAKFYGENRDWLIGGKNNAERGVVGIDRMPAISFPKDAQGNLVLDNPQGQTFKQTGPSSSEAVNVPMRNADGSVPQIAVQLS